MPGHDRASLPLMAQVCVPNGAGLRPLVVDNNLSINIFRQPILYQQLNSHPPYRSHHGPAPFTAPTCTTYRTDLRRSPHRPASSMHTPSTWAPPTLHKRSIYAAKNSAAAHNHVRRRYILRGAGGRGEWGHTCVRGPLAARFGPISCRWRAERSAIATVSPVFAPVSAPPCP